MGQASPFGRLVLLAEAEVVIAEFGYDTPAAITQTTLTSGGKVYGFRFLKEAYPGQVLKNDDHTESRILAVVTATDKSSVRP